MVENQNYVCPLCKYADTSPTVYPCSSCTHIHPMDDHFEPNDDGVEIPPLPRDEWAASMAENIFKKFSIRCGNCPATVLCMARYANPPKVLSDNCVDAFAFWLKRGVSV